MGDCYCDNDYPEFFYVETRKARKVHACSECRRVIEPGETYEHVRGKWDGQIAHFKTCPGCLELKAWTEAHVPCVCWAYGNVLETAVETARDYARETSGFLFGTYRRVLTLRRRPKFSER